jgi:hypothetical protein
VNATLPQTFIDQLNALGFAATDIDQPFTFARQALGNDVWVTVESVGHDTWRVGVKWRNSEDIGAIPNPLLAMELSRLGRSVDGATLDLSTVELVDHFPELLERSILPMVDIAPS